jgi:arylsulfatase A-like enzyme
VNAGIPADKALDGVDLMPFVKASRTGVPHDALFWRMGPQAAVRAGRHKLVRAQRREQLFDLEADIGEATDLARQKPDVLKDLRTKLAAWEAQMKAPAWTRQPRLRKGRDEFPY